MHARTPGHRHNWLNITLGDAYLATCPDCDFWFIQPILSDPTPDLTPATEPSEERSDQSQSNAGGHNDRKDDVLAAEADAIGYYRAKHSSWC
jgi:hypothetical protein